jgi:hypothetical protein
MMENHVIEDIALEVVNLCQLKKIVAKENVPLE